MTITQTVEIPADHRLIIDVPREIPAGTVVLTFAPADEAEEEEEDETEFLMRDPIFREQLTKAIEDARNGRNLITFNTLEDAIKAAEAIEDRVPKW